MTSKGKTWKLTDETRKRQKASWTPERREIQRQRLVKDNPKKAGEPVMGNRDEKHWAWKGDTASYHSIHHWVYRRLGKAKDRTCEKCGRMAYDWANISRKYKRDLTDWMSLCRTCHQTYDEVKVRSWITRKKEQFDEA